MKQVSNENAANRTSYVGTVYTVGEKEYKDKIPTQENKIVAKKRNLW
mgnify:CR=1 FL=1